MRPSRREVRAELLPAFRPEVEEASQNSELFVELRFGRRREPLDWRGAEPPGQDQAERVQQIIDEDKYIPTHEERQRRLEFKEQQQHVERMHRLANDMMESPEVAQAVSLIAEAHRQNRDRGGPEH